MQQTSIAILALVLGLIFGSAINAMVWRLKVGKSWVHGRSVCPECGHTLSARDLVPVVSWLALRGKCRYCQKPIQDSPVVELVTALTFALSAFAINPSIFGDWLKLVAWLIILVFLIVLAVYDARWMLLPDKVMVPLLVVALVYATTASYLHHSPAMLEHAALAALIVGGAFYGLVWFSQGRAMGGGDIKLALVMGLLLGPRGIGVALLIAFNSAAIVGIALMMMHRKGRRDHIAFGPFLVGGTIIGFLYGQQIVSAYLRINGLN